jgi:hypothetical protein
VRPLRLTYAIAALAALSGVLASSADALNAPVPACNGGGCGGGWYRGSVTVSWSFDPGGTPDGGCATSTVGDTSGTTITCTVNYGASGFVGNSVTVKADGSPPSVNGTIARDPDTDGWYTRPVDVGFGGSDGASGLAGCSGGGTYGGPDGAAVRLSGTCTDNAGNSASSSMTIKYDGTPPGVTPAPSRPPDANGWYNHPVDVSFTGADAASGVKECTPAVSYKGPDANPAKLVGQCRDNAGNTSQPVTVELRYDATPPAPPKVNWVNRGKLIAVSWTAGPDVATARVVRVPGLKSKQAAVVYQGPAKRFLDRKVVPGKKYWYEVTLFDQAGNSAAKAVGLKPSAGILSPAQGSVVAQPPLVAWSPVAKARFYNVQLWRGRLKVLTTWVRRPKVALTQRWTIQGKTYSLRNGPYRLYVWPAFGTTKDPRYGKMLGQVGFVVKRH